MTSERGLNNDIYKTSYSVRKLKSALKWTSLRRRVLSEDLNQPRFNFVINKKDNEINEGSTTSDCTGSGHQISYFL